MIELGHLDVNVVTHCNLRCVACSHASPWAEPYQMTPEQFEKDLSRLRPVVSFTRIQLVGGEPTLHKNLPAMLETARRSGVGKEVSVITNARLLPRMGEDFWKALQVLQISVYPGLEESTLRLAEAKSERYGFVLHQSVFTEFYLQFKDSPDGAPFHTCHWKTNCFTVHEGFFYLCPQSLFFPKRFMGLDQSIDGLSLDELNEDKLLEFLNRKEPFNACRKCCGGFPKTTPWRQATTESEWIEGSLL